MSPRYYWISAILVVVLTLTISWWKEKRTGWEVFKVFCQVVVVLVAIVGAVIGLAKVLEMLGIAQSGFFL